MWIFIPNYLFFLFVSKLNSPWHLLLGLLRCSRSRRDGCLCHVRLDKVIITDIHSNCWSLTLLSQNLRHKPRVNLCYLFKTRIKLQLQYLVLITRNNKCCCESTYHSTDKHPECLLLSVFRFPPQREVVSSTRLAAIPPAFSTRTLPAQATEHALAYIQVPLDVSQVPSRDMCRGWRPQN